MDRLLEAGEEIGREEFLVFGFGGGVGREGEEFGGRGGGRCEGEVVGERVEGEPRWFHAGGGFRGRGFPVVGAEGVDRLKVFVCFD